MLTKSTINNLLQKGLLSEIDIYFARFISGVSNAQDPDIFLAAALVSRATGSGDICLNLQRGLPPKDTSARMASRNPSDAPALPSGWIN